MSGHCSGGAASIVAAMVVGSSSPPSSPVTEMAAGFNGFGRVGDMTAQCPDGVHGGAESLGERAADLVLRAVLAGFDIEPHAVENDLNLGDIAIAHGFPPARDNPRIGSPRCPALEPSSGPARPPRERLYCLNCAPCRAAADGFTPAAAGQRRG
jgi:hypothetical protein